MPPLSPTPTLPSLLSPRTQQEVQIPPPPHTPRQQAPSAIWTGQRYARTRLHVLNRRTRTYALSSVSIRVASQQRASQTLTRSHHSYYLPSTAPPIHQQQVPQHGLTQARKLPTRSRSVSVKTRACSDSPLLRAACTPSCHPTPRTQL